MNRRAHTSLQDHKDIVRGYRAFDELWPATWSEGDALVQGVRHHYYRTGGDHPPLVLLHGFLEGALQWLRTARALEGEYDVIMVDARGHGLSDRTTTGFSQDLLTADAAGFLRATGLAPCRLLGFSQGGATGIHVAAADPEPVHSLVVAGWGEGGEVRTDLNQSEGYQAWYQRYISWLEALMTQTHEEKMVSALSQLAPGAPLPAKDEYVTWVEDCARPDLDLVRLGGSPWEQVGQRGADMVADLRRVACPTLVIKSELFPARDCPPDVREEESNQPYVRIVRFTNTGHLIHREQFDSFIRLVDDFFRQARIAGSGGVLQPS